MSRWESFKRRQQYKEQLMDIHDDDDDDDDDDDVSLAVDDDLAGDDDNDDDHDDGLADLDDKLDDGDNTADIAKEASGKTVAYCSVCTQTDMTMKALNEIESDLQSRIDEMHSIKQEMYNSRGYPTMEQLQKDNKVLSFYTGFECFSILVAIFEFVQKGNTSKRKYKLPDFQSFLLTIMKLRLNLYQFDLAFRFGISQSTVSRVFKRWIFLMHSRMAS